MSSDDRTTSGGHIENQDDDYDRYGAWHVSTNTETRRLSSCHWSNTSQNLDQLQRPDTQGNRWQNFQSEDTLQNSPHLSRQPSINDEKQNTKSQLESIPSPTGFWSASLAKTRHDVFLSYLKTLLILCVFVLVVLSIYWGVLCRVLNNLEHATVAVVNFDGLEPYQQTEPLVGPVIVSEAMSQLNVPRHIGFQVHPASEFDNDPMNVRIAVHDEKFWAAIIVNKNATAILREAVETGNSSYDPLGAAQIIYNQARDIESYNQYVTPVLTALAADISMKFGRNWTSSVLANQSLFADTYSLAPQALSPAIQFSIYNLRPFDPPTAIPTISIGLIYLIIIAFFSFGFFIPTHMKFVVPNSSSPHPPLKFYQLVIWRYCATIFAYFCLSLFYSLVSLAFQIPFSHSPGPDANGVTPRHWPKTEVVANADYLGHATFVVYWMLNFMGMNALGLACENMAMLLGAPWTALWLIFWVITNVATGFYSLELASDFYRWGYAWPLRQIVVGSRTLLFGTKDTLGLNFGVLAAWTIAGTAFFPVCCWIFRWKSIREKKRTAALQSGSR